MTCIISEELRFARTQFLLDLAEPNAGKVYPDQFLKAVGGKEKLILNILWIVRRCGYATVDQVREGRKIAYWEVKVTGKCPNVKGALFVTEATATKPVKTAKAVKTVKAVKAASAVKTTKAKAVKPKAVKSEEDIRAANLAKMKKVSAQIAKKAATKKKRVVDYVEDTFGTSGEIATSFNIDPSWDSVEGLDIQKLVV
jgi:hypothetical protein